MAVRRPDAPPVAYSFAGASGDQKTLSSGVLLNDRPPKEKSPYAAFFRFRSPPSRCREIAAPSARMPISPDAYCSKIWSSSPSSRSATFVSSIFCCEMTPSDDRSNFTVSLRPLLAANFDSTLV